MARTGSRCRAASSTWVSASTRPSAPASASPAVGPVVPAVPSLSVGVRSVAPGPAPASLIERSGLVDAGQASPSRRVGLEWKPAQSRVFIRGGLGVRLAGDDRVTMKLRAGQVGLYMRRTF